MGQSVLIKRAAIALTLAAFCCPSVSYCAPEDQSQIPQHLVLVRDLLANVAPNQNSYNHTERISIPNDHSSNGYAMYADCSGLAIALLDLAGSPTRSHMKMPGHHHRPLAEDFVKSIRSESGFERINNITEIKAGDIIAWEFEWDLDKKIAKDTGHVMLVDSLPTLVENQLPYVPNTRQYDVYVIDSARNYHDPKDTRLQKDGARIYGLGKGRIRLYVTTTNEIIGFANNTEKAIFQPLDPSWSNYTSGKSKIGAIGRPMQTSANQPALAIKSSVDH